MPVGTRPFDSRSPNQLMQCRLARPIAIPSAQPVIGYGADPGTQHAYPHDPIAGQMREECCQHQRRTNAVDRELASQPRGIELAQGLFRASVAVMKHAAGNQYVRYGCPFNDAFHGRRNRRGILEIASDRPRSAHPADIPAWACSQGIGNRTADSSSGTDHDRSGGCDRAGHALLLTRPVPIRNAVEGLGVRTRRLLVLALTP